MKFFRLSFTLLWATLASIVSAKVASISGTVTEDGNLLWAISMGAATWEWYYVHYLFSGSTFTVTSNWATFDGVVVPDSTKIYYDVNGDYIHVDFQGYVPTEDDQLIFYILATPNAGESVFTISGNVDIDFDSTPESLIYLTDTIVKSVESSSSSSEEPSSIESSFESSSESSESSAQSSAESSSESSESSAQSSAESSSESSESSAQSSAESSSESSESSAQSSAEISSETSESSVQSSSSTESSESSTSSSIVVPYATGFIEDGIPKWSIFVPGSLGPWNELDLDLTKEGPFNYNTVTTYIGSEEVTDGETLLTTDAITISLTNAVQADELVTIIVTGLLTSTGAVTLRGTVSITTPEVLIVTKRDVETFDIEFTIASENSSSESDFSSSTSGSSEFSSTSESSSDIVFSSTESSVLSSSVSSSQITRSAVPTSEVTSSTTVSLSSSSGYSNSTIISATTATKADVSTIVLTTTKCEEDKCSETSITTGLTVVTTTIHGKVTQYTTYCPLSTESTSSKATTAVTSSAKSTSAETKKDEKTSTGSIKTITTETHKTTGSSSTAHTISTFEGVGQRLAVGTSFAAFVLGLLFI